MLFHIGDKICSASSLLCYCSRLCSKQMPPSADRRLTEPAALGPMEQHPLTKIPEQFIPLNLTIRARSHQAKVLKVGMATARPRLRNRGALSLMEDGFATNHATPPGDR
jgi:hypothetical protein